jgi:glycosyltransferase involved in cell wall biosynthesis
MPDDASPRVSVLMPAYNSPPEIVQALTSALSQTIADVEVIVSDDGSIEPVAGLLTGVRDERVRIIRKEHNRGIAAARNVALAAARAPVVAQLDHDDFWREDHLEHVLSLLADPGVGVAYTNAEVIGHPGGLDRWIAARAPEDGLPDWITDRSIHPVNDLALLYQQNPIPSPAAAMRTDAVRSVGGYPLGIDIATDYGLYLRIRRAGWRLAYLDRRSAVYRWPEPGRGESQNVRRTARHELRLFAGLAVQSPMDRAIRKRLRRLVMRLFLTHVPVSVTVWHKLQQLRGRRDRSSQAAAR